MMMKTRWIMTAMILLGVSVRAEVITATVNLGYINDSATWDGATLPTAGNTDTWNTDGKHIKHNDETFYGGLLSVNSGSTLLPWAASLVLQATTFDNGGIDKRGNATSRYDFSGKELTFASGGAVFISNNGNRNITLNNAVWAGSGNISFTKTTTDSTTASVLTLAAGNTLSDYTGTISVDNSTSGTGKAQLTIEAATTGSFGVNIGSGSMLDISDEEMEYKFSSLVLGGEMIAEGTYAYTDFTAAQQAYLLSDGTPGTVTVIPEPEPATLGLFVVGALFF
jgi:hypothetical protein